MILVYRKTALYRISLKNVIKPPFSRLPDMFRDVFYPQILLKGSDKNVHRWQEM